MSDLKPWERFVGDEFRFGHTSEETALVVDDYPYGFRLRCKIRYWIETTKHGDRLCSQTTNPKIADREVWNKPKKSTYMEVGAIYLDDEGHVTWTGLTTWSDAEWIARFREIVGDRLTQPQRAKLARIIGTQKAFEGVTYSVVANPSPEQREEMDREDKAAREVIARRAAFYTGKAKIEIATELGPVGR